MTDRKMLGFTLLEVTITVAIVALLAAIAWPMYQGYAVKARRSAAAACVTEAGQFMERFYTLNMRYDQDAGGAGVTLNALRCGAPLTGAYAIELANVSAASYQVRARPLGQQAAQDIACGTLQMDQSGARTVSGTRPANKCW